jgi:hypothetical protein
MLSGPQGQSKRYGRKNKVLVSARNWKSAFYPVIRWHSSASAPAAFYVRVLGSYLGPDSRGLKRSFTLTVEFLDDKAGLYGSMRIHAVIVNRKLAGTIYIYIYIYISGLENREYGRRDLSRWPRGILYPQKLALTSPTSGGLSVGKVRSRTQATEFSLVLYIYKVKLSP